MPWRHSGRRPAIYDFADGSLGTSWMPTCVGMTMWARSVDQFQGRLVLVKALQPFAPLRAPAADPRSEWHATAKLSAEQIEAHFRALSLAPPTRNSARSPLLLAVQSLRDMLGQCVEAETIRNALWQSPAGQALRESAAISA
jgi:hypothetical protein